MDGTGMEDFPFPFGFRPIFRGELAISFREGAHKSHPLRKNDDLKEFWKMFKPTPKWQKIRVSHCCNEKKAQQVYFLRVYDYDIMSVYNI